MIDITNILYNITTGQLYEGVAVTIDAYPFINVDMSDPNLPNSIGTSFKVIDVTEYIVKLGYGKVQSRYDTCDLCVNNIHLYAPFAIRLLNIKGDQVYMPRIKYINCNFDYTVSEDLYVYEFEDCIGATE